MNNAVNCWDTLIVGNQQPSPETGRFNDHHVGPSGPKRGAPDLLTEGDDMVWSNVKALAARNGAGMDSRPMLNNTVSPFGEMSVVLNRWQRTSEAYLLDPAYVETKTLRPMRTVPLAKVGDSTEVQLLEECAICVTNTRASGMVDSIA